MHLGLLRELGLGRPQGSPEAGRRSASRRRVVRPLACEDRRVTPTEDERLARAVELRERGELERGAAPAASSSARSRPDDARVAVQTAWVHDSLGLEEEAVAHYEAALAGDLPDEERRGALLGLGSTLRALGRDADSERVLRRGGRALPRLPAPARLPRADRVQPRAGRRGGPRARARPARHDVGPGHPALPPLARRLRGRPRPELAERAGADDPRGGARADGAGVVPVRDGWFVLNARDARWRPAPGPGRVLRSSRARSTSRRSGSTSSRWRRATRWRCTTGRPTRRTSSCSPARRCWSSKARSGRCASGTSCTALPGRST